MLCNVFMPLAGRLTISSDEEVIQKEMLLEGLMCLAKGESSFIIREKMGMLLSQKDRKRINKKK